MKSSNLELRDLVDPFLSWLSEKLFNFTKRIEFAAFTTIIHSSCTLNRKNRPISIGIAGLSANKKPHEYFIRNENTSQILYRHLILRLRRHILWMWAFIISYDGIESARDSL